MSKLANAEAINDLAATWVARFDRGITPEEERELQDWLSADTRHEGAFARAQTVWDSLDRAIVFGAGAPAVAEQSQSRPDFRRRRALAVAVSLAASLATVIVCSLWLLPAFNGERIVTRVGEVRSVPLADGSVVIANTNSSMKVDLERSVRSVALMEGEAWFRVSHDRKRPFIVKAGNIRVEAVGTAFAVRLRENGTEVLVTDGTVEVWNEDDVKSRRRVTAGRLIHADARGDLPLPVEASDEISRDLSWRTGQLVFEGDTVASAADEFNRYNEVKISVSGERLRQKRLVGRFQMNEPESFAETVAAMLNGRVRRTHNNIELADQ